MMKLFMQYIIFLLVITSINNNAVTAVESSVMIYVDNSDISQNDCTLTDFNETLCDVDITECPNITSLTCPDLDNTFNYISTTASNFSFAHIWLLSRNVMLRKSWSLNISLVLTGYTADQSVILCHDNDDTQNTSIVTTTDELDYMLYFRSVQFVRLEFVHFDNCPQPLRIELSYNISILNCVFTNFREAVLDIFNCAHVTIANSNFSDNSGTGNIFLPFRGNTGAVSIGYNNNESSILAINSNILVQNCSFTNNRAYASTESYVTSNDIIARGIFTGRGGALGLLINESFHNVNALIINCQFINNFAVSFGGGIYLALHGMDTQHNVTVDDCEFINNIGILGAGAISNTNGVHNLPLTVVFKNSHFIRNQGETGGAILIFPGSAFESKDNSISMNNNTFKENEATDFGGAISSASYAFFESTELQPAYQISNSTFQQNRCPDGIVNIGYIPFILKGRNLFISNFGPALRVIGSLVQIQDEVNFIDNEAQDGGALFVTAFGQLRLFPNTTMLFERNKGQIGASIVVTTEQFSSVHNNLVNNPLCFILYNNSEIPFSDITDLNFTFIDNDALEGTAIFMLSAAQCTWFENHPPYFDAGSVLSWPFVDISHRNDEKNATHIETTATEINFINNTVVGWPGMQISIPIEMIDETNQLGSDFIQLEPVDSNNQSTTRYMIQPTLLYQQGNTLSIQLAVEHSVKADINSNMASTTIIVRELLVGKAVGRFFVNVTPCLIGYKLTYDSKFGGLTCQCHDDLDYIRNCEDDQHTILLTNGHWGLAQHNGKENLVVYPCPPGYCRCFQDHGSLGNEICSFAYFNGEPDKQCNCDRQGYLCGDCKDGKGVSALLNHCVDCSDANGILIAVLVILDALFISALVYKDMKSTALLFPIIYFVNMISYVGEYFPTSYDQVGKYVYFINSFLSLYYPYDFCLYSGATPLATYTLRYFPVCLTIIICTIGIPFLRFILKKIRPFPVHSLWLLVILQYSHVIYTSLTILNCPRVLNDNGDYESRWFVKGTVNCFTGAHILLGLLAIIFLLICVLLIPFLALVAIRKLKRPHWVSRLAKCITRPFRDELPWWSAVELARKFIFLLFIIPFPQNTFPPLVILMVTFAVYAYMLPYKEKLVNIIELFFQLCFLVFLMIRSTRNIIRDYLIFPGNQTLASYETDDCSNETSIANLTWLLFPWAYLPLVVIALISTVKVTCTLWHLTHNKDNDTVEEDSSALVRRSTLQLDVTKAQQITIDYVDGDFVFKCKRTQ